MRSHDSRKDALVVDIDKKVATRRSTSSRNQEADHTGNLGAQRRFESHRENRENYTIMERDTTVLGRNKKWKSRFHLHRK